MQCAGVPALFLSLFLSLSPSFLSASVSHVPSEANAANSFRATYDRFCVNHPGDADGGPCMSVSVCVCVCVCMCHRCKARSAIMNDSSLLLRIHLRHYKPRLRTLDRPDLGLSSPIT